MAETASNDKFYQEVLRLREHIDSRFSDLMQMLQAVYATRSQCDDRYRTVCDRSARLKDDLDAGLARVEACAHEELVEAKRDIAASLDDIEREMVVLRRYVYGGLGAASVIGVVASAVVNHFMG